MMKKILLSGLLSSTMLLALQPSVSDRTISAHASLSCENAELIGSSKPYVVPYEEAMPIDATPYYNASLPGTTNYNGTNEKYGWVSFEVPVKSEVSINSDYGWMGLFDSECTGRSITTINTTKIGKIVLEAGTYKLAIHDKSAANSSSVVQVLYTPVEEQAEYQPDPNSVYNQQIDENIEKERVGGKTSNDAVLLDTYPHIFTLHLTHSLSWKGKAQRYAWYSFDIEEGKRQGIEFTAPDSGGSWIGIYNENGTLVANKGTTKGTTGHINVDLPKGHYRFFINKSGDAIGNAMIHLTY